MGAECMEGQAKGREWVDPRKAFKLHPRGPAQ